VAALIAAQRDQHQIPHATACRALGVSRSWFYLHKDGTLTARAARRQALAAEVRRLFAAHRGTYGSPRITADLREAGWTVSENTVAAVMHEQGLAARRTKRRRFTTRPGKGRWRAPDLVKRDFPARQLNCKWYGDGTEIPTGQGKLYLASVMDMASRRILGHALGEHHDAQLAYSALVMAVAVRGGQVPGVILHTDQGSEGEFNRSSQHLDLEVCAWDGRKGGQRPGREGRRCSRRVARRWPGGRIGRGSGLRSGGGYRARTQQWKPACRSRLGPGGSARLAECPR
jgi:hypothetical protein